MTATTRWHGAATARGVVAAAIAATVLLAGPGTAPATAADAPATSAATDAAAPITWSTTYTQEETVTVNETATVDGFTGYGSATVTASATATGTATAPTYWEVYYAAVMDAYGAASTAAKAKADAEARPIAKARAQADAQAKADAAAHPPLITWSTSSTQSVTVTVDETATVDGFTGYGSATATASATATGTASATTSWEVYYYATLDAYTKATAAATTKADAEARPVAKARAQADAQAKADAAAHPPLITWSTTSTREETVTVTETATIDGFTGYGTATATASATATGTATATTNWEVYYYATVDAYDKATAAAKTKADAEARPVAKARAEDDARAQAAAAATDPGTGTTGPSCGAQVLKSDGTPWQCTFVDSFNGTSLDTSKWSPVESATSDFGGKECFLDDNVSVADGSLRLAMKKMATPVSCDNDTRPMTTPYTSGSVTSLGKFSQTYGRFEFRAAMPQTSGPGLQSTLWLVPDDPTFYGGWPLSGEIDVAEFYSNYADRLIPAIHYNSLLPFSDATNNHCYVFRPTDFHTYVLEWTSTKLRVSIDGTTCLDHTITTAAPLLGSAPFNRPFNLNLTQLLGVGDNTWADGKDVDEATLLVDYVRAWK